MSKVKLGDTLRDFVRRRICNRGVVSCQPLLAASVLLLTAGALNAGDTVYFEQANALLSGEPSVEDFTELRDAYVETSWYNPAPDRTSLEPLDEAIEEERLNDANDFINTNYFYFMPVIDFHLAAMAAYRDLGDESTLEWHEWFFQRLVDSIFDSGDGESAESAFVTIYEREQLIMLDILGLQAENRREEYDNERLYYVYEAVDAEGAARDVYFDFTAAERWRERQ